MPLRKIDYIENVLQWIIRITRNCKTFFNDFNESIGVSALEELEIRLKENKTADCLFFNWDSLHASLNSHYKARSYKKKKQKRLKYTGVLFRKNL